MGSGGSGRFTDYPGTSRPRPQAEAAGVGEPEAGEPAGGDPCERVREGLHLEEVARCAYFEVHGTVPPVGTDVRLLPNLIGGRLAVGLASDWTIIGYVPTRHNDLASCLNTHNYDGEVTNSNATPVPDVTVRLVPHAE